MRPNSNAVDTEFNAAASCRLRYDRDKSDDGKQAARQEIVDDVVKRFSLENNSVRNSSKL